MKRVVWIGLCLVLAAVLGLPGLARAAEPILGVRGETCPGGILFVSVTGEGLRAGTWHWAGHSGELTPAPYGLRAGLAIPLDACVGGTATLKLSVRGAAGEQGLSRSFKITPKWRPVQYLSMSASNEAKYTDVQADKEEELVLKALYELIPNPLWKGNFGEPSTAPRSSPYGVRRMRNGRTAGFHRGLDYADWEGGSVVAPARGKVTLVGRNYVLLGNCVVVNHGAGLTSIYMHMSGIKVKEGQYVNPGQLIGLVGTTGASTGPHLHYACYFNGEPIDPDLLRNLPHEWAPDLW